MSVLQSSISLNCFPVMSSISDIASLGINYKDFNSSILFGDGAAAAILEKTPNNETIISNRGISKGSKPMRQG